MNEKRGKGYFCRRKYSKEVGREKRRGGMPCGAVATGTEKRGGTELNQPVHVRFGLRLTCGIEKKMATITVARMNKVRPQLAVR